MNEIDEYIENIADVEHELKFISILKFITRGFPDLKTKISYGMPGFYTEGKQVIWIGAFKNHIGIFPKPEAILYFEDILIENKYKTSKGTIQIKWNQEIDFELISKIINFNINNL